jgi:hypothetical protein
VECLVSNAFIEEQVFAVCCDAPPDEPDGDYESVEWKRLEDLTLTGANLGECFGTIHSHNATKINKISHNIRFYLSKPINGLIISVSPSSR